MYNVIWGKRKEKSKNKVVIGTGTQVGSPGFVFFKVYHTCICDTYMALIENIKADLMWHSLRSNTKLVAGETDVHIW